MSFSFIYIQFLDAKMLHKGYFYSVLYITIKLHYFMLIYVVSICIYSKSPLKPPVPLQFLEICSAFIVSVEPLIFRLAIRYSIFFVTPSHSRQQKVNAKNIHVQRVLRSASVPLKFDASVTQLNLLLPESNNSPYICLTHSFNYPGAWFYREQ